MHSGCSADAETAKANLSLAVGRIARPHGLRGELKLRFYNPASTTLEQVDSVRVIFASGGERNPLDNAASARQGRRLGEVVRR